MKVKVLQCDTPSSYTGRTYPVEEMTKAVEQYNNNPPNEGYGTLGMPNDPQRIPLTDISHKIDRLWIENDSVFAEVDILNTPAGERLTAIIDECRLSPAMIGNLDEENLTVSNCEIVSTAFIPNKEDNNE